MWYSVLWVPVLLPVTRRETSLHKEKLSPLSEPSVKSERWSVYHSGKWWMQNSFLFVLILLRYNWYITLIHFQFSSVTQSCPTFCDMDCKMPGLPVHHQLPNSCPLSRWCHPTISSSVVPFSSCPQSFPASGSFPVSQLFTSGGQSIGVSASTSALPMNTQDWSPLGWTGWISLQSKGLSRVFSNTTVQNHQYLSTQLSL